jgi:hypothetical protein
MTGKIEIDVVKLLESGLSIEEYCFLYLRFVKDYPALALLFSSIDIKRKFIDNLEKREWLMTVRSEGASEEDEDNLAISDSIVLRQKAIDFFTPSTVTKRTEQVDDWSEEFRTYYKSLMIPPGKLGIMGDSSAVKEKLKRFTKKYPQYTKAQIFDAAKKYVASQSRDRYRFLMQCDYFIFKQDTTQGKIERSKLLSILEEGDTTETNQSGQGAIDFTQLGN